MGQSVQDAIKVHRHSDASECIGLLTTQLRSRRSERLREGYIRRRAVTVAVQLAKTAIDTMISVCVVNGLSCETFEMQVPEHARISGLKSDIARETSIPTVFQQLLVDNVKVHDNELVGQRRYQLILSLDTACSILSSVRRILQKCSTAFFSLSARSCKFSSLGSGLSMSSPVTLFHGVHQVPSTSPMNCIALLQILEELPQTFACIIFEISSTNRRMICEVSMHV